MSSFIFVILALVLGVTGCSRLTSAWTETNFGCFPTTRPPLPTDCYGICDALEIEIELPVQPFGYRLWELGTCLFTLTNLEETEIQVPLDELVDPCVSTAVLVEDYLCDSSIRGGTP